MDDQNLHNPDPSVIPHVLLPGNSVGNLSSAQLLAMNSCYMAMPVSNKLVLMDTGLKMDRAFHGFVHQSSRNVMLSENSDGLAGHYGICGILSVTDFIHYLLFIHKRGIDQNVNFLHSFGDVTIKEFKETLHLQGKSPKELITINVNQSLLEATRLLHEHHIHRVPVIGDYELPLLILTHKRILRFIWLFGRDRLPPEIHSHSPRQLGVGSFNNLRYVFPETPLHECLELLCSQNISGLPILHQETKQLIGVYSRFDAIALALEVDPSVLDKPVSQILSKSEWLKVPIVSVKSDASLHEALVSLIESNVHRIFIVNEANELEGIMSLSDVMKYLVIDPGVNVVPAPAMIMDEARPGDMPNAVLRQLLASSNCELMAGHNSESSEDD